MTASDPRESAPLLRPSLETGTRNQYGSSVTLYNEFLDEDSVSTTTIVKQESALMVSSTIPIALSYMLQFSFNFVNILSLGHLGANELAASALANMTLFMFVNAPAVGLASALDTFCSTAFTASRDKTLPILIAVHQDPEISKLCSSFVRAQLLGTMPWIYFECVKRYLQAMGHMKASTYVLLAVLPIHLANNYFLVWSPTIGFGFLGAAVANVITFWFMFIGVLAYMWFSDAREAWGGWSMQALRAMPQYYSLAIPSMILVCSDWAAWELLAIAASYLGNVQLAAQTIVINTCSLTYQIPAGLSIAVSNRAGNLLGQSRARRSRIASYVGLVLGALSGALSSAFCLVVASWWGSVYSSDPDVIAAVAIIMPICALFQLSDAVNGVSSGVLRSLGRQTAGAWVNFPAYYFIGFPFGLYLTYGAPGMGVTGLWIGICVGVTIAAIGQTAICVSADYVEEVARCMAQVHKNQHFAAESDEESNASNAQLL
ncbi:ethionine resistance protein [Coemansia sp. RSA 551]|nr:ethionine resistance protein [Coemansia sp. RSA 551]